jgi:hypothetical protein
MLQSLLHQVQNAQAVVESSVLCARKYKIADTQLMNAPEALNLRAVKHL